MATVRSSAPERLSPRPVALVLLVDGSEDCRTILRLILEHEGFRVVEADDAQEGLRLAREMHPALAVTEYPLPVPGFACLVGALRAEPALARVPILTLTSRAVPRFRDEALAAGADRFLAKPIAPREALKVIRELLAGVEAEPG
jgi:two-component system, cell cycle response regulator DivK